MSKNTLPNPYVLKMGAGLRPILLLTVRQPDPGRVAGTEGLQLPHPSLLDGVEACSSWALCSPTEQGCAVLVEPICCLFSGCSLW